MESRTSLKYKKLLIVILCGIDESMLVCEEHSNPIDDTTSSVVVPDTTLVSISTPLVTLGVPEIVDTPPIVEIQTPLVELEKVEEKYKIQVVVLDTVNPIDPNVINMKLQIDTREEKVEIEFDYNLQTDKADTVAQEMCTEMNLAESAFQDIRDLIQEQSKYFISIQ